MAFLGCDKDKPLQAEFFNNKKEYGETFGTSTDVGDVTWITPVGQILTACMPVGVEVHTWQATASLGSSIGMKGMLYAAKVIALSGYDLLNDQGGILAKAKAEFTEKTDGVFYKAGIPDGVQVPVYRALSLSNSDY
jgi:aminobenzoyl-glutamate utilization protein B